MRKTSAPTPDSHVVTTPASKRRYLVPGPRLLLAFGALVLLLGGAMAGILVGWRHQPSNNNQPLPYARPQNATAGYTSPFPISKPVQGVHDKLLTPYYQSHATAAQGLVDSALQNAASNADKSSLYTAKAGLLFDAHDYAGALSAAQTAEHYYPSNVSVYLMAQSAEALGNKPLAIQYWREVLAQTDASDVPVVNLLKLHIKQLGG